MRRALALTTAGLVVILLLAALAIAELVRPSPWEQELERYVEEVRQGSGEEVTILSLARARRPARFTPDMSRGVHGSDVYGHREVPYPPGRLYCLRVQRRSGSGSVVRQVLFAALHRDLHYADWILHEGEREPLSQQAIEALADVGCQLPPAP